MASIYTLQVLFLQSLPIIFSSSSQLHLYLALSPLSPSHPASQTSYSISMPVLAKNDLPVFDYHIQFFLYEVPTRGLCMGYSHPAILPANRRTTSFGASRVHPRTLFISLLWCGVPCSMQEWLPTQRNYALAMEGSYVKEDLPNLSDAAYADTAVIQQQVNISILQPNHLVIVYSQLSGSANLRVQSVSMLFRSSTPPSSLGETPYRVYAQR